MKESKLLLLFMVGFAILFTACTNSSTPVNDSSQSPNPIIPEVEEVSEPSKSTTSPGEKVLISVDYATDELLSQYDSFAEFIEFEDENPQKIIFTTNIPVRDFGFIEVAYKDQDMNVTFFENQLLYSLEELSPTKPFLVTWIEQGALPHRGISFIDETDRTRYFYIAMSGEDGSLLLVEFEN